jgi:SAM-dependent methyltransferase
MRTEGTRFTELQFNAIYPDGIEQHYWNLARNQIIARTLRKNKLTGKILEVGCGRGIVIDYLFRHGFDCYGVELAEVEPVESVAGRIFTNQDAIHLPQSFRDQIKVILLLDVIEHLPDPDNFILQLKTKFSNMESLLVTVPACQELFSNYDEFNGHFHRYDYQMIAQRAKINNFKLIDCLGIFHSLYWPARLTLKLGIKRNVYLKAPKGILKLIHKLLSGYFFLDYLCLPKKLKGTSILAVLKT